MTRTVELTNVDRVLWPRIGFTKGDMIEYYRGVAAVLVPHLAGRPVTLWRFPSGVDGPNWWQNECRGAPGWLGTREWRGQRYCVIDDVDALVWVANLGTIELHPFLHRGDETRPDWIVFDLDPGPPASLVECCEVALAIRERTPDGVAKTSGAAGLHVYVPAAGRTYRETKEFARGIAEELAAGGGVTARQSRTERRGRVLIDWLQNDATRSTVAPYSLRGAAWPTVSTPVTWDEVERCARKHRPELLVFVAADITGRLDRYGDLFAAGE